VIRLIIWGIKTKLMAYQLTNKELATSYLRMRPTPTSVGTAHTIECTGTSAVRNRAPFLPLSVQLCTLLPIRCNFRSYAISKVTIYLFILLPVFWANCQRSDNFWQARCIFASYCNFLEWKNFLFCVLVDE
jgi:hypothetical protein